MNFFERQHQTRRNTRWLVVLFLIAVVLIVLAINTVVYLGVLLGGGVGRDLPVPADGHWLVAMHYWWQKPYGLWVTLGTLAAIAAGSLWTMAKLSGGGRAVAEMVGARRVRRTSEDVSERRLLNVVEEMSIASGTPMPFVYIMDEESAINAFVAGLRPTEAVLVVTRGALETLDRDELQGVIGHEYSHLLNGDMRLNIRLWGILAGILFIGQGGRFLLRVMAQGGRGRSRGGGGSGQAGLMLLVVGLGLFIVGYIGLFFGRIIKAAVARQRESLADASAVQFTRNPPGLAGALWKIKQNVHGSLLESRYSEDMSHMCFGPSLSFAFDGLFATHPPLDERIKAVDPGFSARRIVKQRRERQGGPQTPSSPGAAQVASAPAAAMALAASAGQVAASVGNPGPAHLQYAHALHEAIPDVLLESARTPDGAKQLIYALLLAVTDADKLGAAKRVLSSSEGESAIAAVDALLAPVMALNRRGRLPLLNLALPELKMMMPEDRRNFMRTAEGVVRADQRYTLFEFALLTILKDHLSANPESESEPKYFRTEDVAEEIGLLLTMFARAGATDAGTAEAHFRQVVHAYALTGIAPAPAEALSADRLSTALAKLALLSPLLKQSLIGACADCVLIDGRVMPVEAELMQAVSETLDCPMPPLLDGAAG
jgi:Zn-dependent protease with chaperone function